MPAAAMGQRREQARDMTEEEIANLTAAGPLLPADAPQSMTEAEVALMQAKGAEIAVSDHHGKFDVLNPGVIDDGRVLFRYGKGDARFEGTIVQRSGDPEKVFMWHPITGERRSLPKDKVIYYAGKGWLPRHRPMIRPPKFQCTSKLPRQHDGKPCRKMLATRSDLVNHLRVAHNSEYKEERAERDRLRQERMDMILERLAEAPQQPAAGLHFNNVQEIQAFLATMQSAEGVDGDMLLASTEETLDEAEQEKTFAETRRAMRQPRASKPEEGETQPEMIPE